MRRLVNGIETELSEARSEVASWNDRLLVRADGVVRSALSVRVGDKTIVSYRGRRFVVEPIRHTAGISIATSGEIHAPMPGLIAQVLTTLGATVGAGDKVLVLESMKTQQALTAPISGLVTRLAVGAGDQVDHDQLLAVIEPAIQ